MLRATLKGNHNVDKKKKMNIFLQKGVLMMMMTYVEVWKT